MYGISKKKVRQMLDDTLMINIAFCQGLAFYLCVSALMKTPPAKDSLRSSFAPSALVAHFSRTVLNRIFMTKTMINTATHTWCTQHEQSENSWYCMVCGQLLETDFPTFLLVTCIEHRNEEIRYRLSHDWPTSLVTWCTERKQRGQLDVRNKTDQHRQWYNYHMINQLP